MKSRIVLLLLGCSLFVWSMNIGAEEQKKVDLLLCLDNARHGYGQDKWGYCDRESGKVIIGYQFEEAGEFSEDGLAAVKAHKNGKDPAYYIDATGKKAFDIPADIRAIEGFSEGLARVDIDGKYGYIDNKGKIVIEPRFEDAQVAFKDGIARVKELVNIKGTEFAERYGWIDKTGKVIIKPRFIKAQEFSDGLAMVSYIKGKKKIMGFITDNEIVCFIDKTGKEIITLDTDTSLMMLENRDAFSEGFKESYYGFSDGLAWIMSPKTGKYYAINKRGNVEFKDVDAGQVYGFSEGLSLIKLMDKLGGIVGWAYINKSGKVIIPPIKCEQAFSFSNGMARIYYPWSEGLRGKTYGYIDKQGKMVIKPQFSGAGDFSRGIARVDMSAGYNY